MSVAPALTNENVQVIVPKSIRFQIQDSSTETEQNLKTDGEEYNYSSKVTEL